jgi:peptide subunit release factor 1 (eRF1)
MALSEEEKLKIEDFLEEMKLYRARHTELISVYVPKGFDINFITRQLESEKSTAANIKGTSTRKNVQDALESLIRITKGMKQTPKNGVALFAGNVSKIEGQAHFITEAFEPPEELNVRLYRCDQTFVLEPLEEMLEVKELYGLVVIERQQATIGLLIGKKIKVLQKFDSMVPGKTNKGGQCLSPDTLVETRKGKIKIGSLKVGDEIKALDISKNKIIFTKCVNKWQNSKDKIIEIATINNSIISSLEHLFFLWINDKLVEMPADFIKKKAVLLNHNLNGEEIINTKRKKQNIELIDIETESGNFFANGILVHNSAARYSRIRENIAKEFFRKVANVMKEEFFNLKGLKGILVGGPGPTKEDFLKEGELVTALKEKVLAVKDIGYADEHGLELLVGVSGDVLSEQEIYHEKKLLENFFNMLGKEKDKTAYKEKEIEKALDYGAVDMLLLSKKLKKEIIKKYKKRAEETSVKVELISVDTPEGVQFWNLGGVGAVLRFKIQ